MIIDGKQPAVGRALAEQLVEAMVPEFLIDGKSVRTGLTTGISLFPRDGTDPASLLANAGVALFRAKAKSRGTISIFEPEMDRQIRDRRVLHQDLSNAIRNGELSLHYQPQARTGGEFVDGDVTGFEALARWLHPTRGFVPPGDFIPLAEESGLIVAMGEWILREACREAASWPNPKQIAVNLSPAQFIHGDLVSLVHSILLETGLNPSRLELEITEGVLIEDFERSLALLRRLKALGVRISMDDFGSGYSSLSYFQAFPFDKIKIDQRVRHASRTQSPVRGDRARGDRPRPRSRRLDRRGGRRNPGATRLPRRRGLRRGSGLFHRQASADRAVCRPDRTPTDSRYDLPQGWLTAVFTDSPRMDVVDLTFATRLSAISGRECRIQNSAGNCVLPVVL